jgi:hypothetical protein
MRSFVSRKFLNLENDFLLATSQVTVFNIVHASHVMITCDKSFVSSFILLNYSAFICAWPIGFVMIILNEIAPIVVIGRRCEL